MIKIYFLIDLSTSKPFYVGASKQFSHNVLYRHLLQTKGREKGIGYLQVDSADTVEEAANLEEYWFWQLKTWGFELTNSFVKNYRRYKPSMIYLNP